MFQCTVHRLAKLFVLTDEQAMWRVQSEADSRAFGLLVHRWQARIRALCFRMTGDAFTADDLAQETFMRVYQRRASYRSGLRFSTWLWQIALNLCYDELRRVQRRQEESLDDEATPAEKLLELEALDAPTPCARLQQAEEAGLVRAALMRMPEIYRTVLVLRHYENLKRREIAEVLEIPEGTVNSRMAEALTRLTCLLEPELGPPGTGPVKPAPSHRSKEAMTL